MKSKCLLTLGLLLSNASYAAPVLLEKIILPGFVMEEYSISKKCVIEGNGRLVLKQQVRELSSSRETKLKISLTTIQDAIDKAALGTIKSTTAPVDTGRVEYHAYQKQADGSMKKVILWEDGEGSTNTNDAREAKLLRNFIDLNCGDPIVYN